MVSKYTVKTKGKRFSVTGPRGVWKTTYATETKARKGITSARKHWASMGKPKRKKSKSKSKSIKKKNTKKKPKKKTTKKKVKHVAKKRSWVGWARLGVYILAAGGQAIKIVAQKGMTKDAVSDIAMNYTGRRTDGTFDTHAAGIVYGPLAAVAVVDAAASKLGVYKRMGSL